MKRFFDIVGLGLLAAFVVSCVNKDNEDESLTISSSSFTANGPLPATYSCDGKAFGEGIAPELHWTAGPKATQSYAIVFKDISIINGTNPDPVKDHGYHWMIWDIPASIRSLPEGLAGDTISAIMGGAHQLSGGPAGGGAYLGPCPSWQKYCSATNPAVTDTYSFTIYAFNVQTIILPPKADTSITKNFVHQMDDYFIGKAIAKAEVRATSGAVPTSLPFPCP